MWSRYRPGVAQRVGRCIALLFHDRDTRSGLVFSSTLRPQFSPGKTRYPFYRRLGRLQSRSGRMENLVPTGFRSQTFQPLAHSLYWLSYPRPLPTHKHIYIYIHIYIFYWLLNTTWMSHRNTKLLCVHFLKGGPKWHESVIYTRWRSDHSE